MIGLEVFEILDISIAWVTVPASFASDVDGDDLVFWNTSEPLHDHIGTRDRNIMFSRSRSEKYSDFHMREYRKTF